MDRPVLTWIAGHRSPFLTHLTDLAMTVGTNHIAQALVAPAAAALLVVRRRWSWLWVGAATVVAFVVTGIGKVLIGRPRPPADLALVHPGGYSMPSTDAAVTAALTLTWWLVIHWSSTRIRVLAGAVIMLVLLAVGAMLVYLGAHWPTDVLAGWAVGGLVFAAVWMAGRVASRRWPSVSWGRA